MAAPILSTKRGAITKANAQIVGSVSLACFVVVFCLFASNAIIKQNQYNARLTASKEGVNRTLKSNLEAVETLQQEYKKFNDNSTNVIGGSKDGSGDSDGSNSKIVLDALPSTYDFPALASSIEKIITDNQLKASGITGTDDQLTQQATPTSPTPEPIPIPFSFTIQGANYDSVKKLVETLDKSIRPIHIDKMALAGGSTSMNVTLDLHTYYQPGRNVDIKQEVQK